MIKINGNILVTTDWHFGLKGNQENRLTILVNAIDEINKYVKENNINNIIFCGDLFHDRNNLSVKVINTAIKCIDKLTENCHMYLIVGNHDLVDNIHPETNSTKIFKGQKNITIIENPTEVSINGNRSIFIPWISNLMEYKKNTFDMIFGHFDISAEFLTADHIDNWQRKNNISDELAEEVIKNERLLHESGLNNLDFNKEIVEETFINHKPASDLIGEWITIVKERGIIFSGHIHNQKNFVANRRRFIFIGSPYQQTRNEMNSTDGFYTISNENKICFQPIIGLPKFVDFSISDIMKKGIDNYDFSKLTNNIIHKIIDVSIDPLDMNRIERKIAEAKPYEEVLTTLEISNMSYTDIDGNVVKNSMDSIRKSPMTYLKNHLDSIDDKKFQDEGIDKNRVLEILRVYIEPKVTKKKEKEIKVEKKDPKKDGPSLKELILRDKRH